MLTGETTRISTDSDGIQGTGSSFSQAISADGRYVAFYSDSDTLVSGDTNGVLDAFVKDTQTGETVRISTDSDGTQGNGASIVTAISADGRFVAFHSSATNLVSGDTNGTQDAFIKDTQTGETIRVSSASDGTQGNGSSSVRAISADGRFVAFYSAASNLVNDDINGVQDAFVKDTLTGETRIISTASDGSQEDADSFVHAISADGRFCNVPRHGKWRIIYPRSRQVRRTADFRNGRF